MIKKDDGQEEDKTRLPVRARQCRDH